ncbi:outer membrane beta-barrel protein [Candidatus Cytomitobacter primus]|uniref:Outer membrane protein beta-barrel domain-containing protein n=1 Tax=Candidatus Cytomitobacter primus TaxID=2066024 RepID=A0A5C0UEC8_9PROT|nr:outer membrane beta-barrel protein [Candidatus Cytomitobacter primus]QEK38445.1 hypothetical protein FZC34_00735 [Candidatus Cytomitobacter primus]
MNNKFLFLALLSLSSHVSAKVTASVVAGGVVRKTNVEISGSIKDAADANKDVSFGGEFKKDGNASYFAGRATANLFMNKFGIKVSADLGSDKKNHKNDADKVLFTSKSNFGFNAGPAVQYKLNDKISVHAAALFAYRNIKISATSDSIINAADADKKHYMGFGGNLGLNYHFNARLFVSGEFNVDYIMKKENSFKNDAKTKFDAKKSVEFNGSLGLGVNILG